MIKADKKEAWTDKPEEFKIYRAAEEKSSATDRCYFSRCTLLKGENEKSFKEITMEEYNKIEEERNKEFNQLKAE